ATRRGDSAAAPSGYLVITTPPRKEHAMDDKDVRESGGVQNRPAAAADHSRPAPTEAGGPPDSAPETGGPAFSKGAHRAGEDTGPVAYGSHDLHAEEASRRGGSEPPRR